MGSSERARGGSYIYRASKAAATNLGRNLATDLAPRGIAVGIYHPGWVRTDMGGSSADISLDESVVGPDGALRRSVDGNDRRLPHMGRTPASLLSPSIPFIFPEIRRGEAAGRGGSAPKIRPSARPTAPCAPPAPSVRPHAARQLRRPSTMPILVMKFGGTSVATLDRIRRAAKRVGCEVANGYDVIVIVSAMSGKTNELVGWVEETSPLFDAREYDAVVSSGENVTAGLMALTLQEMDVPARSWQGWQVPVQTTSAHASARIEAIPPDNIMAKFAEGMRVAVVAGFQGISPEGRITTLGRGGSDTTAVAFAAAFGAERCDIYTDVDGVYTTDPRITTKARKARPDRVRGDAGAGVAGREGAADAVGGTGDALWRETAGAVEFRGTQRRGGHACLCRGGYRGKQCRGRCGLFPDEAKLTLTDVEDRPGIAAAIFGPLAEAGVNVDMIVQNISEGGTTDMTFSCPSTR
jgi:aspartate kinase